MYQYKDIDDVLHEPISFKADKLTSDANESLPIISSNSLILIYIPFMKDNL